jgi:tyrosyl-tRNA synthetase
MDCRMQLGGSDQWGNITTGMELIRRKLQGEAYGLTCPLIKKADGTKFGKTESGNIWLDARYTSPYRFYQFWLNTSDEDAKSYIKIFTMLGRDEIDALIAEQDAAPHLRPLQKRLAEEVTVMIHSRGEYEKAVEASQILFGGATAETLRKLDEQTLLAVFDGVPTFKIKENGFLIGENQPGFTDSWIRDDVGINIVDLLVERAPVFQSKGELRKLIASGGISLNKQKVEDPTQTITENDLIAGKYLLVQKGKKNYYLIIAE